jgi:hypothetical protein
MPTVRLARNIAMRRREQVEDGIILDSGNFFQMSANMDELLRLQRRTIVNNQLGRKNQGLQKPANFYCS